MKILITSIVDIKKSAHNSRLHQFLKYLSKHHEITVLSINDWWKEKWDEKSEEYSKDFGKSFNEIENIYLTDKKISPVIQELYSIKTIKNILEKIDYKDFDIHYNYNTLISGYITARYFKNAGINTIYDIADDLPGMIRTSPQIHDLLKPIGGFVGDLAVKRNINISKKVTFTTDSLRDSCEIPISKSIIIPNGVDIELFRKLPQDEMKNELGINNSFVVGHVGVLREWLDFEALFTAVSELRKSLDIKMLIVGGGIGYEENVKLAEKYGLQENIVFTGTVPYSQIPKYISCMDTCVIPFKLDSVSQNSLPLKLFEYMACEKPVISSRVEGIMAAVNNNVLYASSAEEYKSKILELSNNEDLREKLGSEGRKIVEREYDWSRIASELEQLMYEVRGT